MFEGPSRIPSTIDLAQALNLVYIKNKEPDECKEIKYM